MLANSQKEIKILNIQKFQRHTLRMSDNLNGNITWNTQQRQVYTHVEKMKPTLLMGDYGTGLCRIVMSTF